MKFLPSYEDYRSMYNWAFLNSLLLALLGASNIQGWVYYIFEKDVTFISHGIAVALVFMLVVAGKMAWNTCKETKGIHSLKRKIRQATEERGPHWITARSSELREVMRNKLMGGISLLPWMAGVVLFIGVLGTVLGLIIGLKDVTPESVASLSSAVPTVASLIKGLSVAFHTTLVGGVCALWLQCNHYLLTKEKVNQFNHIFGD
jgi:hypothetical protein